MATQTDENGSKVTRGRFFETYETVVVQVESTLHRIPKSHLKQWSQLFKDMFALPQGPESEGTSEQNPIVLSGCKNEEFEAFMDLILTPRISARALTSSQRAGILRLAMVWDMPEIRRQAIAEFSRYLVHPVHLVYYGKLFKVASWLIQGYASLGQGRYGSLDSLAQSFGWETAARIAYLGYLTSELPKSKSFKIPVNALKCPGCKQPSLCILGGPSHTPPSPVDVVAPTYVKGARRTPIDSVLTLRWTPGKDGDTAKWDCEHLESCKLETPTESGLEYVILTDLVSGLEVDNKDLVKELFADELKDMY